MVVPFEACRDGGHMMRLRGAWLQGDDRGENGVMALDTTGIDDIDRRILGAMRIDGRISWRELGERVHLSATSTADRVRRLERLGVITGYQTRIDPAALGRTVRAVIDVDLPPGGDPAAFEAHLARRDEIVLASYVTGPGDYTIVADCEGPTGLDSLVRWLKAEAGAARTESKVVLRDVIG
jgi:Lrp/AsnC family leucine-responsive transcriptional regulator